MKETSEIGVNRSTTAMAREDASSTFVIIPAYNEEQVIRETVERVLTLGVQVVVVDDCSLDNTVKVTKDLPIYILRHAINLGQGAAIQTGVEFAIRHGARYLVTFDADGQHDEQDIPRFINTLAKEPVDIVLGSRFLGVAENISRLRTVVLKVAIWTTGFALGLNLTDVHNGLRAFRSDVAGALRITQNRMAHASEILSKISQSGLRFKEVPCRVRYTEHSRTKGQSNWGAVDIIYELTLKRLFR